MAAGLLLCIAWYYTIISGFFVLYCPTIYLMFFDHKLYRKVVDALFALWELYPVALFQCIWSTQLHHFGDYVNPDEHTIIVMNHRTRVDWNYVWIALYHATQDPSSDKCICKENWQDVDKHTSKHILDIGGKSKIKFVLKDEIKTIPGLGWIMQLNFFLYVKRNWQEDQLNLYQFVDYYHKINCDCRIVLFPEGTDLSKENRHKSEKFALTKKLDCYHYVLHPRTTGWAVLCSQLRDSNLASVYDVTVAYDNPAQTELDLLKGKLPSNVYFHFKRYNVIVNSELFGLGYSTIANSRYSIDQLPNEEDALRNWLNDRWREKEISLRKFHHEGNFVDTLTNKPPVCRTPRSMLAAKIGFIFWTTVNVIFTYCIFKSILFQFWVLYHIVLFIIITWHFGGFHNLQYKLLDKLII